MAVQVQPIKQFSEIALMAKDNYLYVLNHTSQAEGNNGRRGVFHMDIKDESGESFSITIPDTWIPMDLANLCDPNTLLRSQNFRSQVNKNNLIVITKEAAEKMLATTEAQAEQAKVQARMSTNAATNVGSGISIDTRSSSNTESPRNSRNANNKPAAVRQPELATAPEPASEPMSVYDQEMHSIITDFSNKTISEREAIVRVSLMEQLPTDDCLKTVASSIGRESINMFKYIGAMMGASHMPPLEETFPGGQSELSDMII